MISFKTDAAMMNFEQKKIPERMTREKNKEVGQSFGDMLENKISSGKKESRVIDKKLMDTCVEMESIFVAKMLKEMRSSVPKTKWLHGGFAEDVFQDMLYDEYSMKISEKSNLGLAKMLYNDLSRR